MTYWVSNGQLNQQKKQVDFTGKRLTQPKIALMAHSQLWDRADLDTSFLTSSPQPGIKVHIEIRSNFCLMLFSIVYQKTCFLVSFCSFYDIIFIISG